MLRPRSPAPAALVFASFLWLSSLCGAPAATFSVVTTNDTGAGSLRTAILDANTSTGADILTFAITNLAKTIVPVSALPAITGPLTIDGTTQPGFTGMPLVELNGTSAGTATDGLQIQTSNCIVRALVINRFSGDGIEISGGGSNNIEGCYIGLSAAGTADQGNTLCGIVITNSFNNSIGGISPTQRNFISGNNQHGILIGGNAATNNQVRGNVIGLAVSDADLGNTGDGVRLMAARNIIGGATSGDRNVIAGNTGDGIEILGPTNTANQIRGNYIGTDSSGTLARANGNGVFVNNAGGTIIGGAAAGEGNLIAGNSGDGVELSGASTTNSILRGNLIGADFQGTGAVANGANGVFITSSSRSNLVGGINAGEANLIAFNTDDGIGVAAATSNTNNTFRGNSIFANGGLGIDLGTSGVAGNDNGDADTGANQLQNYPLLTAATNTTTNVVIVGTLNSRPNTTYQLDVFCNFAADSTGNGEGQTFLGTTNVTTGANSNAAFAIAFATPAVGRFLSATATDPFGNTSEFSPCLRTVSLVPPSTITVTTPHDSGPGSLRQALLDLNTLSAFGTNLIRFGIPGSGVQTISPTGALPAIVDPIVIDGYSQPVSHPNTATEGFDAAVLIRLDGANAGAGADGLALTAGHSLVRGLMITRFGGDGIEFTGGSNNVVEGCVIGLDAANTDQGNTGNGIYLNGSAFNVIGGLVPATRNVVSGNNSDGIEIGGTEGTGNRIVGNFIGTDFTGAQDLGNSAAGINLNAAPTNTVGGTTTAARNIISGNNSVGVIASAGANGNHVLGNYIGTDVTGTSAVGNADGISVSGVGNLLGGTVLGAGNLISGNTSEGVVLTGATSAGNRVHGNIIGPSAAGGPLGQTSHGISLLTSAHDNSIGGLDAGAGNVIAFNGGDGIFGSAGTNNAIRGCNVFGNGDLGIDLGTSGVTGNDPGDADTGANQLQNFPILAGVTNSATNIVFAGTLESRSNTVFHLDFYANPTNDPSGFGEGWQFLGSGSVTTDATGLGTFLVDLPGNLPARFVCATATDPFGNTSEFGPGIRTVSIAPVTNLVVVTTNDSGPGSLRQALLDANGWISAGNDVITFNIPGAGIHTFAPATPLPALSDPVTLDGYTQPGASANSRADGDNAVLRLRLDGVNAGAAGDGLRVQADGCRVRGLSIVRYGTNDLIEVRSGSGAVIEGCFLGADPDGSTIYTNTGAGVRLTSTNATNVTVGGTTLAARNVISGNGDGVVIEQSSGHRVAGNFIGTDASGTLARPNAPNGVRLQNASNCIVGGTMVTARNVISGNGNASSGTEQRGVKLSASRSNFIQGNYIGLTVHGVNPVPNDDAGVGVEDASVGNVIGGTAPGAGNVISANNGYGIAFPDANASSYSNRIEGNFIGVDSTGTLAFGNTLSGVYVRQAGTNFIGGGTPGARNVISGNGGHGVFLGTSGPVGNLVQGNFIGTDAAGAKPLGNAGVGVLMDGSLNAFQGSLVGGTNAGEGNLIWFNGSDGVQINDTFGNAVLGNSIYSNSALGIDLRAGAGVTANDPGDPDNGGNRLQNYPVLTLASVSPTSTVVHGSLNSSPNQTFRLEFFANDRLDSGSYGEGQIYVGFASVTTGSNSNEVFVANLPVSISTTSYITATATDSTNNTSEFSKGCRAVPYDSVDLAVALAASGDPVSLATNCWHTLSVTNHGPADATGVVVLDTLPFGASYISASASQGSCTLSNGFAVWAVGSVTNGGWATAQVTLRPVESGDLVLQAGVSAGQHDHTPANDYAYQSVTAGISDVGLSITATPDPLATGSTLTYVLTTTNRGPDGATALSAAVDLSPSVVLSGLSTPQGMLSQFGNQVFWEIGALPAGGSARLTMTCIPTSAATIQTSALLSFYGSDPNPSDHLAAVSTTVNPGPGIFRLSEASLQVMEDVRVIRITVQRTGGSEGYAGVSYTTLNLTATAGLDYVATNNTIQFPPGFDTAGFDLAILDDTVLECNESFAVRLFNPTDGAIVLTETNATVTITDDQLPRRGTVHAVSLAGANTPPFPGNDYSYSASLSADGRFVAFLSGASNLAANDANGVDDVFVRDRVAETTLLVSANRTGTRTANAASTLPQISADGRYVAFESMASDLVEQETLGHGDVFVRDLVTGTNLLVSRSIYENNSGNAASMLNAGRPCFSTNGQRIVYLSSAWDLTPITDANFYPDVFVRDLAAGSNRLISINRLNNAAGAGHSSAPSISADGRHVVFQSAAPDLVIQDSGGNYDIFVRDLAEGETIMVSVNTAGTGGGNNDSTLPLISAAGRFVAFQSRATDLTALADANAEQDIFWRDTETGVTRLVSVNQAGTAAANGYSWVSGLTDDGRFVLFESAAPDLVAGDVNGQTDVFLRDMVAGITELISTNRLGTGSGNSASYGARLSPDGRRVVFLSEASNLTADSKDTAYTDLFVRDRQTGMTTLCSLDFAGGSGGDEVTDHAWISANGQFIAFDSLAANLWPSDDNGTYDVFVRDLANEQTLLASANVSVTPRGDSFSPLLNTDGRYAGFTSRAGNIVANDANGTADAFLTDLAGGSTTLVSVNTNGFSGNGQSFLSSVSADGRHVAFESEATDLSPGDANGSFDAFVRDRLAGATVLLSVNAAGSGSGNGPSRLPILSPDGRWALFKSRASNLTTLTDTNTADDVILRDTWFGTNDLITVNLAGTRSADRGSEPAGLTPDGRYVLFMTDATDLVAGDSNNAEDVFLRDRAARSTRCISLNRLGTGAGAGPSSGGLLSTNARYVAFSSLASDLVAGDTNGFEDVFLRDTWSNVTQVLSVNRFGGVGGNSDSWTSDISADGRYVVFVSKASNLVSNDGNGAVRDVFLRDRVAGTTTLVSVNCEGLGSGDGASENARISADGRYVVFESQATDLVPGQFLAGGPNVFRRDLAAGVTSLLSENTIRRGAGNSPSWGPVINANGSIVLFESVAMDLISGDLNYGQDVFAWVALDAVPTTDLALTKLASTNQALVDTTVTFTLTVTNLGPTNATAVTVTDPLPAGFSNVSAVSTAGSCSSTGGVVTASIGNLGIGAGARITITAQAATLGWWTNIAVVSATEFDSAPANNRATAAMQIQSGGPPPTLSVAFVNNALVLAWPSAASGYQLQTTTNLTPTISWTLVTNTVSDNGTWQSVVLTPEPVEPTQFYRLKK